MATISIANTYSQDDFDPHHVILNLAWKAMNCLKDGGPFP